VVWIIHKTDLITIIRRQRNNGRWYRGAIESSLLFATTRRNADAHPLLNARRPPKGTLEHLQ